MNLCCIQNIPVTKTSVEYPHLGDPRNKAPDEAVSYLAEQLGVSKVDLCQYDFFGAFRAAPLRRDSAPSWFSPDEACADRAALASWIATELCPGGASVAAMMEAVFLWCRDRRIFGLSRKEMERIVRSERQRFLESILGGVADRLRPETVALMEISLADPDSPTGFHTIKGDAGAATLDNMLALADRLAFIKKLDLPRDLLSAACKTLDRSDRSAGQRRKGVGVRRHAPRRQLVLYT
ncbi:MAG: hypothetical protein E5X65_35735, partial [Mesorhizobium sp.]